MTPFAYQSLAALAINVVLAAYILSRNPRGASARVYLLLLAAFILWDVPELLLRAAPPQDPAALLLLVRFEWTGIALIPGLMAHFVLEYPRRSPFLDRSWGLLALYAPSIVFTSFLWGGDLLVQGVVLGPLGHSAAVGPFYLPLATLYALIILLALFHLGQSYATESEPRAKRRYALLFVGFFIPVVAGIVTEVFGPFLFRMPTRLGLGTAYTTIFTAFMAYAVFRYGFLVIEPEREAAVTGRRFGREKGQNYLILERGRDGSYPTFRDLVQDTPGLCVTAFPPPILSRVYGLRRTPFLWLTSQGGHPLSLKPTYLEVDVLQTLLKFLRDNPGAALLLDDLEYLAQVVGFKPVLRTLSRVVATASKHDCTLLASASPGSMPRTGLATLTSLFDQVETAPEPPPTRSPRFVPSECILWMRERDACFDAVSRAAVSRKTFVTTLFPGKLQVAHALHDASFLWVTSEEHPRFPTHLPSRLTLEVVRDVSKAVTRHSLLYLGELEVLAEEVSLTPVLKYVKDLVDLAATREILLVASVAPDALKDGARATLERRFATVVA